MGAVSRIDSPKVHPTQSLGVSPATDGPTVAGKCEPEPAALAAAADRGFDAVELYLERDHLDALEETVRTVEDAAVSAVSVHTPHVTPEEREYYELTDRLAVELDAYLVLHSKYVMHVFAPDVAAIGFSAPNGHENNTGASVMHLEEMILARDNDLVLDTAHLYTAEREYLDALEYLLSTYPDQIGLIHLTDSTRRNDGLAFGDGEIDLAATVETIRDSAFDGPIVLEVMPESQAAARDAFERYWTE
ncbi:deoxyribonuclease IV protein [Halorhabdus tiamatea SARL4B]|uniref:Deoxyribonuclease IV protein n=1 Tax=Halorhabdus tiamatea SARL4B TaxID=1033806 RepID=F7PPX3_9EURY|nr:TIM barrel protein [Halorhabdus tiamatea]ERJ05014.1 deoxyribonuclease IV protein [Halorhabdus tiamatea SARL4B]CCQ32437.1 xylose isomerase TIM barrel-like domain protein [Halorhabdus tiamatea SARL4B]